MKNGRKPSNLVKSHFIRLYIGSPSTTLPSSEHHWHDFVIHYYVWNKIHKSHMTIFWAGSIQMIPFLMQTFFFSYKVICVISASRFLKRSLMNGIYQNCSDVLWEKIVLVIEKTFWNHFIAILNVFPGKPSSLSQKKQKRRKKDQKEIKDTPFVIEK